MTPGPWEAIPPDCDYPYWFVVKEKSGLVIAMMREGEEGANARAIAMVPDLLRLLGEFIEWGDPRIRRGTPTELIDEACALLARIKGG